MSNNKKFIKYPHYLFRKQLAGELIKKYVPPKGRFLEVGCATGDFGFSLADRGYSGVMIDFSHQAAEIVTHQLATRQENNLAFKPVDIMDYSIDGPLFDLVTIFEVLEHVERDYDVVKKINKLLKPGGYVLFSVPARKKFWSLDDDRAGHVRRYEKDELFRLLVDNHFEVIKLLSYGYPFTALLKAMRGLAHRLKKSEHSTKGNIELTKKSGFNIIRIPFIEIISNKFVLFLPIQFSKLFQSMDLSDSYLCLAKKK